MAQAYFYNEEFGQFNLRVNPYACDFSWSAKTSETETEGGKVIQILGVQFSTMTISGEMGLGDTWKGEDGFDAAEKLAIYVRDCMSASKKGHTQFVFPSQDWHMTGWFEGYPQYYLDRDEISPAWSVPFHIAFENGGLTSKAMDEVFKKVQDGIGNFYSNENNVYRYPNAKEWSAKEKRLVDDWAKKFNVTPDMSEDYYSRLKTMSAATAASNTPVSGFTGQSGS